MSNQERHPILNYDLKAPLPYFLTDEEIYGKYTVDESQYSEQGKLEIMEGAKIFADFLNTSSAIGPNGTVATIDENVFVRSFLPHFYSEQEITDKYDPRVDKGGVITSWVRNVAGGVYNVVNVLRNGEVIYRVPPVYGQLNAVGPTARERSLRLLIKDAEEMWERLPASKNAQLAHALNQSLIPADPDADRHTFLTTPNLKYLFVMDEIFTYYGYDSILTPEIMSIKKQVFGERYVEHRQSSGTISRTEVSAVGAEPVEDDSDLFG